MVQHGHLQHIARESVGERYLQLRTLKLQRTVGGISTSESASGENVSTLTESCNEYEASVGTGNGTTCSRGCPQRYSHCVYFVQNAGTIAIRIHTFGHTSNTIVANRIGSKVELGVDAVTIDNIDSTA